MTMIGKKYSKDNDPDIPKDKIIDALRAGNKLSAAMATDIANMNILSNILGGFISVGVFALIIVFQQEIRRFLLILGSNRITNNKSVLFLLINFLT